MINKAFKIRLYPTVRQEKFFSKTFGTCRFIYNQFIALKKSIFEETRMSFTPKLASFKEEWPWMREADSQGMANAYMDAKGAYQKFFDGKSSYPRFKKIYPSSKLCHCCGYKNTTLTLADREWSCPNCGT